MRRRLVYDLRKFYLHVILNNVTHPHLAFERHEKTLSNKVILVTGAGDGIGKQAAITYAECGATVVLLGRTVSKLETTYDQIVAAKLPEPSIVPLDLKGAQASHYEGLAQTIKAEYGRLDGVLLNASILGNLCPFGQIKHDEFDEVMQVNLRAQFLLLSPLLPLLKASENASVIFSSSSVGRRGRAFWGAYAISKFATEGMMQTLADEYKNSNIRFNCINPGGTRTNMRAKAFPAEDVTTLKTPLQIMPTYAYLMADISRGVNGESLDCQPK